MSTHPIRGKTFEWTFRDGPMAGKVISHAFHTDGSLDFKMLDGDGKASGKPTHVDKYEVAKASDDVHAVSYLSDSGYTLTVIMNLETNRLAAFSSNEKELGVHHGTFEPAA